MRARIVRSVVGLLLAALAFSGAGFSVPAYAAPTDPQIAIASSSAGEGEEVDLQLTGWSPGVLVSVAVCGSGSGSSSCAMMAAAQAVPNADGDVDVVVVVAIPPDPCPCEIRALSVDGGAESVAFDVEGAEIADAESEAQPAPPQTAVLEGTVRLAGDASWREQFALGGSRVVTIAVTNTSQVATEQGELDVVLGRNTRSGDVALSVDIPSLPPGGSFEVSGQIMIPAGFTGKFVVYVVGPGSLDSIASTTLQSWAVLGAAAVAMLLAFGWAFAGLRHPSQRSRAVRFVERSSLGLVVVGVVLLYVTLH
ncbi:hypothetical protein [Cumulibacter soli]|uniref:hypothetical protein n=1 Tax=Cumulibacter soli TaxID=2546344 RepID=UPI001067A7A9|nr:hypothetical protein [Cumulibacter soli]